MSELTNLHFVGLACVAISIIAGVGMVLDIRDGKNPLMCHIIAILSGIGATVVAILT